MTPPHTSLPSESGTHMELRSPTVSMLCVFALLMLSACAKSEERENLASASYEIQTYIGSKPWQKCTLKFEAGGKANWDENGSQSSWNYDVSDTEIMLANSASGRTMHLEIRKEGLYGSPCGGTLKKVG
jgi:outer membrane biogenesis lipoprotein LolB